MTTLPAKGSSHPLQLDIEMATSRLIVKAATSTGIRMIDNSSVSSLSVPPTTLDFRSTEVTVPTRIVTKDDREHHGTFLFLRLRFCSKPFTQNCEMTNVGPTVILLQTSCMPTLSKISLLYRQILNLPALTCCNSNN
jgi:hypothetical protein